MEDLDRDHTDICEVLKLTKLEIERFKSQFSATQAIARETRTKANEL